MVVTIPNEIIKEIADNLDSGMKCFYHIHTGEVECYPDELKGYPGFDEELWKESMDKVENNYGEYISFEGMESHQSFDLMKTFVDEMTDAKIQQRFEDAISYRKPFQNFKQLLNNYPGLRQQWFDYKTQQYVEWVQEQLETYNALNNKKEN